jgi:hypothetical protein
LMLRPEVRSRPRRVGKLGADLPVELRLTQGSPRLSTLNAQRDSHAAAYA